MAALLLLILLLFYYNSGILAIFTIIVLVEKRMNSWQFTNLMPRWPHNYVTSHHEILLHSKKPLRNKYAEFQRENLDKKRGNV